jgi:3-hydroxy-9,10-secoandrosta-1,3,5(10)-triene-9,17-dione monooxygenase
MADSDARGVLEERAQALLPTLERRAAEAEALRKLPPETVADLKRAALHRLCQPRRYGGAELPLDAAVDVITVLARGCAAIAWVCAIYCDHSILLGRFDDAAGADVWGANPDALVSAGFLPAGTAERVAGGWRISGKWGFASGCDYADWLLVGSPLADAQGQPMPSLCLVPRREVAIEDNWHVMGLAGTGSKNLVIESTVVPDYRILPLAKVGGGAFGGGRADVPPLYRLPHFPTVPFLFLATGLGIAESLLELTIKSAHRPTVRGPILAEVQSMQLHIAEAAAEIDCARTLVIRDCAEAMAAMREGRPLTMQERARNRRDQGYAGKLCRNAVERLFGTTGAHGIFLDNAAQRKLRDMYAVSGHISGNWDLGGTAYGRVALGLDPATMFI